MKITRKEHKGENGKVLVIGGSQDYVGAPALAAMAALRTGVDNVTVCAPEKVAWAINSYGPELITKKFPGEELHLTHAKEIIELADWYDVVVLGCGLGLKKDFVLKLLREIKKPFVIDADAIKVISIDVVSNSVLTPNLREFGMLCANTEKKTFSDKPDKFDVEAGIKAMQKYMGDNVVLLKGPTDIIFTKHLRHLNKTGNNSMTIGGTGDILAGMCAGFIAQKVGLFESAVNAASINGKLGEHMSRQMGNSFTSSEMVKELWRYTRHGLL
jgi:ADP-dependent NAD(P)H-hydrate dehydratase / NAD(P)H-hydrate epimerase